MSALSNNFRAFDLNTRTHVYINGMTPEDLVSVPDTINDQQYNVLLDTIHTPQFLAYTSDHQSDH